MPYQNDAGDNQRGMLGTFSVRKSFRALIWLFALLLREALAAQNGSVALRLEGNSCDSAANRASSLKELSLTSACVLLCVAASLTSLRLVLEALFCIELLLAGCENEICAAILALECLVCVHKNTSEKIDFARGRVCTDTFVKQRSGIKLPGLIFNRIKNCLDQQSYQATVTKNSDRFADEKIRSGTR